MFYRIMGRWQAKSCRDRMEPFPAVKVVILAGVDHIKACCPEGDGQPKEDGQELNFFVNSHPDTDGREPKCKSKEEVAQRGKSLRIGVAQQNKERKRAEIEREGVDPPAAEGKKTAGRYGCPGHEGARELAGGYCA